MSARKSVFCKRTDSGLYHTAMSLSLQNLQSYVRGYIEIVPVGTFLGQQVVMVCNEEGKLRGDILKNFWWDNEELGILDCICGDVLFCSRKGEGLAELVGPKKAFKTWLLEQGLEVD